MSKTDDKGKSYITVPNKKGRPDDFHRDALIDKEDRSSALKEAKRDPSLRSG